MRDLFSTRRIFVLKNFLKLKKLDFFIEQKLTDKIILDSEKAGKSKIFGKVKNKALYIECNRPKPWLEESDFVSKTQNYLKKCNFSIENTTAKYLYNHLGYNLYRLHHELQKLMMYKENPTKICKKDI